MLTIWGCTEEKLHIGRDIKGEVKGTHTSLLVVPRRKLRQKIHISVLVS